MPIACCIFYVSYASHSLPCMSTQSKVIITLALLLMLGGLGTADYLYSGEQYAGLLVQSDEETINEGGDGVKKNPGPMVEKVLTELQLQSSESNDLTLLAQVVKDGTPIESRTVLQEGDRAGTVTWVESPRVKDIFIALKEALLTAFSPQVRDLKDQTLQEADAPVRNLLTFIDPALSEERIVFVRVRERLYEFHITEGKEDPMNALIDGLTGK